jgi:DNA-binding XRE family transcriptional regulator
MIRKGARTSRKVRAYPKKGDFMEWLRREVKRRGGEKEVAVRFDELMLEDQLTALRRKRGISQAKLAKLVGVSQPVIARIESGRVHNLTIGTIIRTAVALGGRVEILIKPNRRVSRKTRKTA